MTTLIRPDQLWSTMPGWGIYANLTPPEVLVARKLRLIRKLLIAAFTLLLLVGIACYGYATMQRRAATDDLASEQARTAQLQAQQRKYAGVVQIQGSIGQVQSQVASLMTSDVDLASLLGKISAQLPTGMTIDQLAVVVNSSAAASSGSGAAALDASGRQHIGSVTVSGSAKQLADVSSFVDKLKLLTGVVEPYPASNQSSSTGVKYNVQLTMTNQLFTHRFAAKNGTK